MVLLNPRNGFIFLLDIFLLKLILGLILAAMYHLKIYPKTFRPKLIHKINSSKSSLWTRIGLAESGPAEEEWTLRQRNADVWRSRDQCYDFGSIFAGKMEFKKVLSGNFNSARLLLRQKVILAYIGFQE
jgi:hypothetical protein